MSSGSLFSSGDVHIKQLESPSNRAKPAQATAWKTDTHTTSSQLRLNRLTLDQLSEELDRRTTETQKLQDEVENATKLTLERFGMNCAYGIPCSQRQSCLNGSFNVLPDDPPADSATLSTQQQALTQPLTSDEIHGSCPGEGFVGESLQQLLDIPLAEEDDPRKAEARTFSFNNVIMNLQTELHKVQMEKDVLSALRLTDSAEHVGQMEKMLSMLVELQNTERAMDQKLSETENEALSLNRRVEKLEQLIKERFFSPLSQNKHCETVWAVENHVDEEYSGRIQQKEKMEDFVANLGQEMALLTNKLSTSKNSSVNLIAKFETLKEVELAEKQALLHQSQVCDFVSAVSRHKNKVCYLEQQLIQAQSQLKDAQGEREHCLQHSEDFQTPLNQLKQQDELQEEVGALRRQLEKAGGKKNSPQVQLEQKTHEEMKIKDLLEEKVMEVHLLKQETQQHLDRLEEAQRQYQTLQVDRETLGLKVNDQEKMINILRLQVENNTQVTVQQGHTINILHQENSFLSNQLNQNKLTMQQLRTHIDQHKSDLAEAELERQQLQGSVAEHIKLAQEQTVEKQELTNQLELQRIELVTLKKEHRELQQLHRCKEEEYKGVVLKLQSRIKRANDELDQVRAILRNLKEANGHGLKAAVNTKERIIARREQLNPLEGKIQHLIQTVEKLNQERHHQNLEHQLRLQELTVIKEEKRQLDNELEALRSNDKHIREWISRLEQILDKLSERFAECQDFIQLQEQEFFNLKLQRSLDSMELQGQHLHTAVNEQTTHLGPPPVVSTPLSFHQDAHARISPKIQQDSPTQELRSLVKELKAVISENHRPHTDNNGSTAGSFQRRRSAPERVNRTTLSTEAEEIKAGLRFRRKTSGSETHLKTSEVNGKTINKPFKDNPHASSPARYPSSAEQLLLGRKSPVYYLLTSDPNQPSD